MVDTNGAQAPVLFRELPAGGGMKLGVAQLNAEKSLNALNLPMIRALAPQLRAWAEDPAIACMVLYGSGEKAFCAGGDVRFLRDSIVADQGPGPNAQAQAFFSEEYRLDYFIHTCAKPILLWGSGIVMGGGLGLMAGASHRVVTETSRIAMPEITLGLYPDVGGSWFLRRMPGRTGLFLALTGAALNGHDALTIGLADFFLKANDRNALFEHLSAIAWNKTAAHNHATLSKALRAFAGHAVDLLPASNVRSHADMIQRLTDGDNLTEIYALITGYQGDNAWLKRAAAALASGSPSSAALIWELWQRAKHMSLAQVFRMELIVSLGCCSHPDFAEGVRALLVDKDGKPRWTPPALGEVSAEWVAEHFSTPWSAWLNESNPLADI